MRQGQRLLSLGEKVAAARLDAACDRVLAYDVVDVCRLHRILLRALDEEEPPVAEVMVPRGSRFVRPADAFGHRLREASA